MVVLIIIGVVVLMVFLRGVMVDQALIPAVTVVSVVSISHLVVRTDFVC